ncbi:MAG: alpha/beta hydrolase [Myxococcota bacterium]
MRRQASRAGFTRISASPAEGVDTSDTAHAISAAATGIATGPMGAASAGAAGAKAEARTRALPIEAWMRPAAGPTSGRRIYIEGDGHAWATRRRASSNPTPIRPVALELAIADPSGEELIYLGRPCQYSDPVSNEACRPWLWTQARFGKESINALSSRVDDILTAAQEERPLTLVGYSGGGVIALLLAARRDDVERVVTVAAPLDVQVWSDQTGTTPLYASETPMTHLEELAKVEQLHFTGARDGQVGTAPAKSFIHALSRHARTNPTAAEFQLKIVPDADHSNWPEIWPELCSEL